MQFQPEDWDDEKDGEWTPPTIANLEYKGPWEPKVRGILNQILALYCDLKLFFITSEFLSAKN